ncbi:hypothetical protein CAPTEDRAFT_196836 [Capitella teleta]|uniref:O-methyltransferase domain-containing protein n=1 Tax=Capitella teleta TaxID=283909 RepID=R7VGD6_CAPTE|nr:hypothetical protein CAPTEDRAFT_196836 [Capitella teleta]|eukprot:ELU17913.1 hypothetical protein CAPTEDRAFT_196836 [Capitella teleta]
MLSDANELQLLQNILISQNAKKVIDVDALLENGEGDTYDMVFIDADKTNYDNYYELGLKLVRKGGVIAVDNALWAGKVMNETDVNIMAVAIRNLNKKISNDARVNASPLMLGDRTMLAFKK